MILDRIKKFISEKLVPKEMYIKIESPEEYRTRVNQALSYENAELKKRIRKLENELKKKDEEIKALKEKREKEVEEELKYQEEVLKRVKKAKIFDIFFETKKPIKLISSLTGDPFYGVDGEEKSFLKGIRLFHTSYGPFFTFLLGSKKGKFGPLRCEIPLTDLPNVFSNPFRLVHELKRGIVEVNITPEGEYFRGTIKIPIETATNGNGSVENEKKKRRKDGNKTEVPKELVKMMNIDVSLLRDLDPKIARGIIQIYAEIGKLRHQLKEAMISEKTAWSENVQLKTELDARLKEIDSLKTYVAQLQERYSDMQRKYHQIKLNLDEAQLRSSLHEISFIYLTQTVEKLYDKLAERYGEDIATTIRKEFEKNLTMLIEQVANVLAAVPKEVIPPGVGVKGEAK